MHIWLVRSDGSSNHRLTATTIGGEQYPVFSADGKYVYYIAPGAAASEGDSNLWRTGVQGQGRRQITHFPPSMNMYELNRAGNKLTFISPQGIDSPIYMMNLNGSGRVAVPNTDGGQSPHLNPNATALAFYSPYGAPGIMTVNVNGSNLTDRTPGATYLQPSWSPDGKEIACIDGGQNLFVMKSDGSNIHEVGAFGAVQNPIWQPNP